MNFEQIFDLIIKHEGETYYQSKLNNYFYKFGISSMTHGHLNIANLTKDHAMAIHKQDYWDKHKIESLPPILRLMVYEVGIIFGFPWAFKRLSFSFPPNIQVFAEETLTPDLLKNILEVDSSDLLSSFTIHVIYSMQRYYSVSFVWVLIPRLIENLVKSVR